MLGGFGIVSSRLIEGTPMSRTILASCFVVCILLVGVAGAQPPSADANVNALARRHFREGSKAYSLGDFARAIREYRAAFEAKADPAFLYNIAQSYRLAGDPAQ